MVKAKLGPLYPADSQFILRYVCHLSFIWRFIVLINPLTCHPLFSSVPFVLSYIWDKDAKVLPLSHSLYPELQLNRCYENGNLTKIHLKVRQSGKVVMSGYNRLFAVIVIHIVPNRHTGERGMHWNKINYKGDYHSAPGPDREIRGRGSRHPDPDIRRGGGGGGGCGAITKKFLLALRASVWYKNKGAPPLELPLSF